MHEFVPDPVICSLRYPCDVKEPYEVISINPEVGFKLKKIIELVAEDPLSEPNQVISMYPEMLGLSEYETKPLCFLRPNVEWHKTTGVGESHLQAADLVVRSLLGELVSLRRIPISRVSAEQIASRQELEEIFQAL